MRQRNSHHLKMRHHVVANCIRDVLALGNANNQLTELKPVFRQWLITSNTYALITFKPVTHRPTSASRTSSPRGTRDRNAMCPLPYVRERLEKSIVGRPEPTDLRLKISHATSRDRIDSRRQMTCAIIREPEKPVGGNAETTANAVHELHRQLTLSAKISINGLLTHPQSTGKGRRRTIAFDLQNSI